MAIDKIVVALAKQPLARLQKAARRGNQ